METETFQYLIIVLSVIINIYLYIKDKAKENKIESLKAHGERCRNEVVHYEQKVKTFKNEIKALVKENKEYKLINTIQKQRLKDLRRGWYDRNNSTTV